MDVFAHVLWTNAVFHAKYHNQRRLRYLAALFGVLPDLISFAPLFAYLLFSGNIHHSTPNNTIELHNWTVSYAQQSYNYTHSLVIFAAGFILIHLIVNIYLYFKKGPMYRFWFFWPLLGWLLHILIDIPSHRGFYETPFLFPLSNTRFSHGMSWGDPRYMAVNYSSLIIVYFLLYLYQRKKLNGKH